MYKVYILYSAKLDKYYIGQTNDLERRMYEHNSGQSKYTKLGMPWVLVFAQSFQSRSEAMTVERKLKLMKSKEYIKQFIAEG